MDRPPPQPLLLVVAAALARPGVEAALALAEAHAREGTAVGVLFTEEGLEVARTAWPGRLAAAGARSALCGRSARARREDPASFPPEVQWTSLTAFLRELPDGVRLWGVLP